MSSQLVMFSHRFYRPRFQAVLIAKNDQFRHPRDVILEPVFDSPIDQKINPSIYKVLEPFENKIFPKVFPTCEKFPSNTNNFAP